MKLISGIPYITLYLFILLSIQSRAQSLISVDDSIRASKVDSIFTSLKDTTQWQSELDYIRSSISYQTSDSLFLPSLLDGQKSGRTRWKDKEDLWVSSIEQNSVVWTPNPRKATIMALIFPGGGQIYNRKFWKLPIVYGGVVGCVYALSWNNQMYSDYSNAFADIMDNDPNTKRYEELLPPNFDMSSNEDWLKDVFKNRNNNTKYFITFACDSLLFLPSALFSPKTNGSYA